MTDQEINIAIARECGWECDKDGNWKDSNGRYGINGCPPHYATNLNAMHDAEKTRICYDPEIQETYSEQLLKAVLETYGYQGARMVLHASAHQRAKAFLCTLHLWKE
jgi:hypothetical protein